MSKTLGISRTIRRRLPQDWFVSIGKEGLTFHRKRKKEAYTLYWDEAIERSMFFRARKEARKPNPVIEVKPVSEDPRQMLFSYAAKNIPIAPEMVADHYMKTISLSVGSGDDFEVKPIDLKVIDELSAQSADCERALNAELVERDRFAYDPREAGDEAFDEGVNCEG